MVKTAVLELLDSPKLISRKILVMVNEISEIQGLRKVQFSKTQNFSLYFQAAAGTNILLLLHLLSLDIIKLKIYHDQIADPYLEVWVMTF